MMLLLSLLILLCTTKCFSQSAQEAAAVIKRFTNDGNAPELSLSLERIDGCDLFETSVRDGKLTVKGSSPVSLCRGYYDFVRTHEMGICSWTGNRCELPKELEDEAPKTVVSPFKHHYYFNVVTFGYTMPYWDWSRWEKEIDWMALHGVDMPLALVANEAISARVWKKLGLTDEEIAAYFVGPAHFPWMRMGNISGVDGPLPSSWHKDQVILQHKILDRMKALGMKPVCPAFAGFVPQTMQRLFPDLVLLETSWCGGAFHNWMISPDNPLFQRIGQMFIEEWEKEFGKNGYYIIDSFNEMDIPFPPKDDSSRYTLLANYGKEVYNSIKAANPDAVWVMQGWMFGYQRDIWDFKTLQALLSEVPEDKMLLLDLAVDYNKCFWKTETNWNYYEGMFNKEWVYSVIPNMGGKTGMTGILDFYANGRLDALNSPNKGKMTGYGMAPEGLENNEAVYELICDAGWTNKEIDLTAWLDNYSACRYGHTNDYVKNYWKGMLNSVYGSFTDHPRYSWQFRPGTVCKGSINANSDFYSGIESLAKAIPDLKNSPLFVIDMVEMTAQYLGAKMDVIVDSICNCNDLNKSARLESEFEYLATATDRILCSHPVLRLENWLGYARKHGDTPELKDYYERNARRIVTVWGPPVDDYSARIWSGLIRDYYLPRWQYYFANRHAGTECNFPAWELYWVEQQHGLSEPQPYNNVLSSCLELLKRAEDIDSIFAD